MDPKSLRFHRLDPDVATIIFPGFPVEEKWAKSEYPHPLVTVDFNVDGEVIEISTIGSLSDSLEETIRDWIANLPEVIDDVSTE